MSPAVRPAGVPLAPHPRVLPFAALLFATQLVGGAALGTTLQIDTPWNPTGPNSGTLGSVGVTMTSSAGAWRTSFTDEQTWYNQSGLYGSLAVPVSEPAGDFFGLQYSQLAGDKDTLTITLSGALTDPIFFFNDIDVTEVTVTVSAGGTAFSSNAQGSWAGNVLTANSLTAPGTYAAVQYGGTHAAGTQFTFTVDYSGPGTGSTSNDFFGVGIAVVPEPGTAALLMLGGLALRGRPRRRNA